MFYMLVLFSVEVITHMLPSLILLSFSVIMKANIITTWSKLYLVSIFKDNAYQFILFGSDGQSLIVRLTNYSLGTWL